MIQITDSEFNFEIFAGKGIFKINNIEGDFNFIFEPELKININFYNADTVSLEDKNLILLDIANHLKNIYKKYIKGL